MDKNGTSEDVKKVVSTLNTSQVPSKDVVGKQFQSIIKGIHPCIVVSFLFVFIPSVKCELKLEFQIAAQNCWVNKGGAFTGEISAEMLVNLGIPWVIIGHSERRALMNESNEIDRMMLI
ncbi:hypothetical protein L2E82_13442 [Cichorium intybus]|uniref:Uncharacterized protein n=1 Tax=Cichorium intybus TaxID=13427 RepID=A0ACB9EY25_CICIN|nr:hypothetical protein L2E82_13442 [Cichorium intybus]